MPVNNSRTVFVLVGLFIFSILSNDLNSFEVDAQQEDATGDRYVNSEIGFAIDFPEGWVALDSATEFPVFKPASTQEVQMTIRVNGPSLNLTSLLNLDHCPDGSSLSLSYGKIGGAFASQQSIIECKYPEGYSKTKTVALKASPNRETIEIIFSASSSTAYDEYITAFEDSLSTVSMDSWIDSIERVAIEETGMQDYAQYVSIKGKLVGFSLFSSAPINNFQFDEASASIYFDIDQPDRDGSLLFKAHGILEEPFKVTVDGKGVIYHKIVSTNTSDAEILFVIPAGSREVSITGSAVIAEPDSRFLTGMYSSNAFEIILPDDWIATEEFSGIHVSHIDSLLAWTGKDYDPANAFAMWIAFTDLHTLPKPSPGIYDASLPYPDTSCIIDSQRYTLLNEMIARESALSCSQQSSETQSFYAKRYDSIYYNYTGTDDKKEATYIMMALFLTSSQDAYERNVSSFDQSMKTAKIQGDPGRNSVVLGDVRYILPEIAGLDDVSQEITVDDNTVDLRIHSNSTVSDLKLGVDQKLLSLTVEGESNTAGMTVMDIGKVLEGPYVVAIDGNPVDDFLVVDDEIDSSTVLTITYPHSVHEITVTGTNVVPEFPLGLAITIAVSLGAITVLFRTRIANSSLR